LGNASAGARASARQRHLPAGRRGLSAFPAGGIALSLLSLLLATACGGSDGSERPAYIALGDSLSVGIGASDLDATGFVPLVHQRLEGEVELLNLGHSGDTSRDLFDHGHLDEAVAEIERRNGDGDPANDVRLVTLEIGGNDLLRLYFSLVATGLCPDVATSLEKPECAEPLASALRNFEPNLRSALERLAQADEAVPVVLLTIYNPFGHVPGVGELGELSLEGRPDSPFPEGLNDVIRTLAAQHEVLLVDVYPLFQGRSEELIASDTIHPNDRGYQVIAEAVLETLASRR